MVDGSEVILIVFVTQKQTFIQNRASFHSYTPDNIIIFHALYGTALSVGKYYRTAVQIGNKRLRYGKSTLLLKFLNGNSVHSIRTSASGNYTGIFLRSVTIFKKLDALSVVIKTCIGNRISRKAWDL